MRKEWKMPEWMVKYCPILGVENRETVEKIYNGRNPLFGLMRSRMKAKIELLSYLEKKRII